MAAFQSHMDGRDSISSISAGGLTSPSSNNTAPTRQAVSPETFSSHAASTLRPFGSSQRDDRAANDLSSPPSQHSADQGFFGGSALEEWHTPGGTLLVHGLPFSVGREALISMFLFSEDFVEAQAIPRDFGDDSGFTSAVVRFRSLEGAQEARQRLHGKLNAANNGRMVVELLGSGSEGAVKSLNSRRKTLDALPNRKFSNSASSGSSNGQLGGGPPRQSRFNKTFQSLEKLSPHSKGPQLNPINGDLMGSDAVGPMSRVLPPASSRSNGSLLEHRRMSGKAVINDDSADDETGELLKDPIAFARNGSQKLPGRRASAAATFNHHPMPPISRLGSLSLVTTDVGSMMSPTDTSGMYSARTPHPLQSPIAEMSSASLAAGMTPLSPTNSAYPLSPQQQFSRHPQYPPANPADQNPPCNTLYVGNLPQDTSEDELKAMFSKQRGYKRLCFRTKHNGPMCFVEFEDVSFATKALNELYGHLLHNSVKGGIRLSFSKNPLGVRSGQNNNIAGPQSPLTSPTSATAFSNSLGAPPGFGSALLPPPGLAAPPGLNTSNSGLSSSSNTSAAGPILNTYSHNSPPSGLSVSQQQKQQLQQPLQPARMPNPGTYLTSQSPATYMPNNAGFAEYSMGR